MVVKTKRVKRRAVPLTLDEVQIKKLETLAQMDGSDRTKVIRKAIDYAFENPREALAPRIS